MSHWTNIPGSLLVIEVQGSPESPRTTRNLPLLEIEPQHRHSGLSNNPLSHSVLKWWENLELISGLLLDSVNNIYKPCFKSNLGIIYLFRIIYVTSMVKRRSMTGLDCIKLAFPLFWTAIVQINANEKQMSMTIVKIWNNG